MMIAAFELIPTDDIYEKLFAPIPEGKPVSENFETLGLEHHLLFHNFGTMGFFGALYPIFYAFYFIIKPFMCCKRCKRSLRRSLFWNALLRYIIESYLIGLLCALINLNCLELHIINEQDSNWSFFNHVATIFVVVCLALFPIWTVQFLLRNNHKVN